MNVINKNRRLFANFLLVSGIGALGLSIFAFGSHPYHPSPMSGDGPIFISIYYIFNSALLILLSILLHRKKFKAFGICSVLLFISVTISLGVFYNGDSYYDFWGFDLGKIFTKDNLFMVTVKDGISVIFLGGPIITPMFLISVYLSPIFSLFYRQDL